MHDAQHPASVVVPQYPPGDVEPYREDGEEGSPPSRSLLPERDHDATTIIVDGYGASIQVEHGQLSISDGLGSERRSLRLARATTRTKRILVLATTGIVSLTALRWCEELGIELVAINRDGNVTMQAGTAGRDDARLRRAQAFAPSTDDGLAITRYLIGQKVRGQRDVLTLMGYEDQNIDRICAEIETAQTIEECISLEREMAVIYWQCWSVVPLKWKGLHNAIPEHWRTVGLRGSPRSRKGHNRKAPRPRHALTPANAILNYCYRLAEIETTIALRTVGLDPGLAIVHADRPFRNSMALDCLEAIRPAIDIYVYRLLSIRTFTRKDFQEQTDGVCRIQPNLAHELALTLPQWRTIVAPVVEHVLNVLRPSNYRGEKDERTPLTKRNTRQGVIQSMASRGMRVRDSAGEGRENIEASTGALLSRREQWLARFFPAIQDMLIADLMRATGLSHTYIRQIKAGQRVPNPRQWPLFQAAIDSPGTSIKALDEKRQAERNRWTLSILPSIKGMSTSELARATDLSERYIRALKAGKMIPHPARYAIFQELASRR